MKGIGKAFARGTLHLLFSPALSTRARPPAPIVITRPSTPASMHTRTHADWAQCGSEYPASLYGDGYPARSARSRSAERAITPRLGFAAEQTTASKTLKRLTRVHAPKRSAAHARLQSRNGQNERRRRDERDCQALCRPRRSVSLVRFLCTCVCGQPPIRCATLTLFGLPELTEYTAKLVKDTSAFRDAVASTSGLSSLVFRGGHATVPALECTS
jgi:hypothetical protein